MPRNIDNTMQDNIRLNDMQNAIVGDGTFSGYKYDILYLRALR